MGLQFIAVVCSMEILSNRYFGLHVLHLVLWCIDVAGYKIKLYGKDMYSPYMDYKELKMADTSHSVHSEPLGYSMNMVSLDSFSKVVLESKSYHDVMRVFLGPSLSDETIDAMLTSQDYLYPSTSKSYAKSLLNMNDVNVEADDNKPKKEDLERYYQHSQTMILETQKNQCKHPKPKLFKISDFSKIPNRLYQPECTILYRCRQDSACCNRTSECGPKTNKTVTLTFLALDYVGVNNIKLAEGIVKSFTFINHTECECKPIRKLPECKMCPFPFEVRRNSETCTCHCRVPKCKKIRRGKSALPREKDLECIKAGKCYKPDCQFGEFDIKTGYCPRKHPRKNSQVVINLQELEKEEQSGDEPHAYDLQVVDTAGFQLSPFTMGSTVSVSTVQHRKRHKNKQSNFG